MFVSDLELGNVLLFPIDDKQSRLDGQDQVGSVLVKARLHTHKLCSLEMRTCFMVPVASLQYW